jgi:L-cysteine desulfidase
MKQDNKHGLNQKPIFKVKDVLKAEVAPALGCTEPVAIALAAAAAASLIPDEPVTTLEIWVDPNIYKNGIAVAIPGTQGLNGLDLAGALGALGGDPSRRLEVLATIDKTIVQNARKLLDSKKVSVNLLEDKQGIYVKTIVNGNTSAAEAVIESLHDNIVSLRLNGKPVVDSALLSTGKNGGQKSNLMDVEAWLKQLSLSDLVELLDDLDDDDLTFLEEGVQYNMRLAEYGLKFGSGLGIGKTLERLARQGLIKKDMIVASRILTAAASDARMAGVSLPAMSSAGSGNHGLTAILPIWAVKDYIECDKKVVLEAIAISHIITAYVKAHTGRLSAICGCSVAAGAGAAAGITHLLGGTLQHMAGAITNLTEDLAGVICDGAKAGCSLKLATAAGTAVQSALFALQGVQVQSTDGIVATSAEKTMQNVGRLSTHGMIETDRTILKIMLDKQFSRIEESPAV